MTTLRRIARDLAEGRTTSEALTETALARIEDPAGEGRRAFLRVDRSAALAAARASDALRAAGVAPGPLSGVPISIKDLFDVAGQTTKAGSTALADAPPAERDAPVVARLRAAGAVIVGRTNMTEFAYSGIGINPHYGTPANPHGRDRPRIPGGSSSGAAVSVTDGMAVAAIGSDTGGSVRIPAALCGITGFKPSMGRLPMAGVLPLSTSLDTVGPLAASVDCCRLLDAVMAGAPTAAAVPPPLAGLRLAVPQDYVLEDMDETVARAFAGSLSRLSAAGARVTEIPLPSLHAIVEMNEKGGFAAAESYAWHRRLLKAKGDLYDPRVSSRIRRGAGISAADYIALQQRRVWLQREADAASAAFDAMLMPTSAIVAPEIDSLDEERSYIAANALILRNTSVANFLDRPAVTLPVATGETPPVGLSLVGETGGDARLLALATAVEALIVEARGGRSD